MTKINPQMTLPDNRQVSFKMDLIIDKNDLEDLVSGKVKGIGYYDSKKHPFLVIRVGGHKEAKEILK